MDADETAITNYLKTLPGQFVGSREIARRTSGRSRFRNNPGWALPILSRLVEMKIIESDGYGHYRLKAKKDSRKRERWVSPQIRQILERSGKNFEGVYEIDEDQPEGPPPR